MLDYDPTSKLYLVKRVFVPNHILEKNSSERQRGGDSQANEVDNEGAGRVSDGEEKAGESEETARADGVHKDQVNTIPYVYTELEKAVH